MVTRVIFVNDNEMDAALANAQPGDIIIPTSFNYPAIDCVLVFLSDIGTELLYLFVQVTQARDHHITGVVATQHLAQMVTVCGGVDRCAIAFFIPPRSCNKFTRQNITGSTITQLRMTVRPGYYSSTFA